jgi:hypothetical protein
VSACVFLVFPHEFSRWCDVSPLPCVRQAGEGQIASRLKLIHDELDFVEVTDEDADEADGYLIFTSKQILGMASKLNMLSPEKWKEILEEEPTLQRLDQELRAHDAASGMSTLAILPWPSAGIGTGG